MSRHLMARMRRTAFDWKAYDHPSGGVEESYRTNLENGHYMVTYRNQDPDKGWSWGLFAPGTHPGGENPRGTYEGGDGEVVPYDELVNGGGSSWSSVARWKPGRPHSTEHLPTFDHARQQAEEYYRGAYPLGTDTGGHDSGVDYDSFFRRDDPDDDFGRIFGRASMGRHLMARFRPLHAAPKLEFPWMLHEDSKNGNEVWHAPLENGHRLKVFDTSENEPYWGELEPGSYQMGMVPADEPQSHWKGGYHLGLDHPDAGDPEAHAAAGYPDDWHAPWKSVYNPRSTLRGKAYPTREKAMLAVEREYKKHIQKHMLTQRAQNPAPRQEPQPASFDDFDYGDIFGGGS